MKTPIKSFEIIKEMYEYFVEKYRDLEPKLMICEKEDFDNVETALKRLEELDSLFALTNHNGKFYVVIDKTEFNQISKKLKALEIMKTKLGIEKEDFFYDDVLGYMFVGNVVSKEQYDLLKEVLLCQQ